MSGPPDEENPLLRALQRVQAAEAELGAQLRKPTSRSGFSGWMQRLFSFSQATETDMAEQHLAEAFTGWRRLGHCLDELELCLEIVGTDPDATQVRAEIQTALAFYRQIYQQAEPLVRPSSQHTPQSSPPENLVQAHKWLDENIDPLTQRLQELDRLARLRRAAHDELNKLES